MAANPANRGSLEGSAPGLDLVPATLSDTVDEPVAGRAIRCSPGGTAGTLRFTTINGNVRNTSIALGETLVVNVKRIHQTGTTATGIEVYI